MPGRVNQIEVIDITIARLVLQSRGLCLDGDSPLALDIHRVENLLLHLAVGKTAAKMNNAVSERRLAMIDMGNDRKIANMVLLHQCVQR